MNPQCGALATGGRLAKRLIQCIFNHLMLLEGSETGQMAIFCVILVAETVPPKNDAVGRGDRPISSDPRIRTLPRLAVGQKSSGADGSPPAFSWRATALSVSAAEFCYPETIRQSGQNRRSADLGGGSDVAPRARIPAIAFPHAAFSRREDAGRGRPRIRNVRSVGSTRPADPERVPACHAV